MQPHRLVSFIVPAYNCAGFITQAVESILAQSLSLPFEIVIFDDASTDSTMAVVRDLAERHSDVITVGNNEKNLGDGATRNRAIAEARGDLLYALDSDNILPSGTVQPQIDLLLQDDVEAVSVQRLRYFRDSTSDVLYEWEMLHHERRSGLRELFASSRVPASHGNYLFTRRIFDAVGGYEEGPALDPWRFGLKHILAGFDVGLAPGTFYWHRIGHVGQWQREYRAGWTDRSAIHILKKHSDLLPPDLQEKVSVLRDGDPFFVYMEKGAFTPEGRLPSLPARVAARLKARARRGLSRLQTSARPSRDR